MKKRYKRLLAISTILLVVLLLMDIAFPLNLKSDNERFAQVVLDRHGQPLRAFPDSNGVWRYPVTQNDVSPYYLQALLGYEDRWFYYHPGINPFAIIRATIQNISNGRIISGGSTLTMQVARLLHPHKRTLQGKSQQVFRALQLEWHLSKREILELYLNHAPFGGTLEGVQAASHAYLQKSSHELSRAEAALMAVLPQSPSRLRPDRHPLRAQAARDKVLNRLVKQGIWSQSEIDDAQLEGVTGYSLKYPMTAPLLARRLVNAQPQQRLIYSTIDRDMQLLTQEVLTNYAQHLPPHSSVAALVVDNGSAKVRAYVGSADFSDKERFGQVDMIKAIRSPGSTLKPFLYGLAIDDGLIHSESLLVDVPRERNQYRPGNFNSGYSGPVSTREALQQSLNVPAVNLLEHYGPQRFAGRLRNAGFNLQLTGNANLAVILGGVGTSLESLVEAYLSLAHRGNAVKLNYHATALLEEQHLFSEGAAWIIRDILSNTPRPGQIRYPTAGKEHRIAWKTGTSYGYRDAWSIGVSANYTIGIWVGRPDSTPMPGHWGGATAAPLMFQLFNTVDQTESSFPQPPKSVQQEQICWPLGIAKQAQKKEHCQREKKAWILAEQVPPTIDPSQESISINPLSYWVNRDTGLRVEAACKVDNPEKKSVALWPQALDPWLARENRRFNLLPGVDPSCSKIQTSVFSKLQIVGVSADSILRASAINELPTINLKTLGAAGKVNWYINGEHRYKTHPEAVLPHKIKVAGAVEIVAIDSSGARDRIHFRTIENSH